jgi:hypothetical protein
MQRGPLKKEIGKHTENDSQSTASVYEKLKSPPSKSSKTDKQIEEAGSTVRTQIIRLIDNDPELKGLIFKKADLSREEKAGIFRSLAANHYVERASFEGTSFDLQDAIAFHEAFSKNQNKTLKVLNLSNTDIGPEALELILKTPLALKSLFLNWCDLGDEGAEKIAKYAQVADIALIGTEIGAKGVEDILTSGRKFSYATYSGLATNVADHKGLTEKLASFQEVQASASRHLK